MNWDAVNARARGLATHLLDRRALAELAASPDWTGFIARLGGLGYPLDLAGSAGVDLRAFDRAVGLVASARLTLLGRWLAAREPVLAVVLEDEERRSLRALLRGAVQGASPGARMHAVIPTPGLPIRAIERMAHVSSVPELVRDLVRQGHPAGRVLQDVLRHAKAPDLRALEWALTRLFRARAIRAARPGGPVLRRFAAELVDQDNVWTLLLAAPTDNGTAVEWDFVPGGTRLARQEFVRLRLERDGGRRLRGLRALLTGTALGTALAADPPDLLALESGADAARIAWLRGAARRDPLGPAVVLAVMERIRAEARALRSLAWGVTFGAPAATLGRPAPEAA